MTGMITGRTTVYCNELPSSKMILTEPMVSCTAYDDKRRPQMYEMEEMAWIVRTDRKKGVIGFVSPEDMKKEKE